MWTHADKYAVKVYIGDDEKLPDFGWFGVTTHDGGETWFTRVTPAVRPIFPQRELPTNGRNVGTVDARGARQGAQGDRTVLREPHSRERGVLCSSST